MNSPGTQNSIVPNFLNKDPFDDFELDDEDLIGVTPSSQQLSTNSQKQTSISSSPQISNSSQNLNNSKENRFQQYRRKADESVSINSKNNTPSNSPSPSPTISDPLRTFTIINDDDEVVEQPAKKQKIEEKDFPSDSLYFSPVSSPDLTQKSPQSKLASPKKVTIVQKPQIIQPKFTPNVASPTKEASPKKIESPELPDSPISSPDESLKNNSLSDVTNNPAIQIRRKIPGPIGNLPSPKKKPIQVPPDLVADSSEHFIDSDFGLAAWCAMMELMQLPPFGDQKLQFSINYIQSQPLCPRVPMLCVMIKFVSLLESGATRVTLKDITGQMEGTINENATRNYLDDICIGSVLILKSVAVFNPSPNAHFLNITNDNILKIFHPKKTQMPETFTVQLENLPSIYSVKKAEINTMQHQNNNQQRAPLAPPKSNYFSKKPKQKYTPKNAPRASNSSKAPSNQKNNSNTSSSNPPVNNQNSSKTGTIPGKPQPVNNFTPPVAPNTPISTPVSPATISAPSTPNLQQQKITNYQPPKPNVVTPNTNQSPVQITPPMQNQKTAISPNTSPSPIPSPNIQLAPKPPIPSPNVQLVPKPPIPSPNVQLVPKPPIPSPIISNSPNIQSAPKPPVQAPKVIYQGPPSISLNPQPNISSMGTFSRMNIPGNRAFMNNANIPFSPTPQAPLTTFSRNVSNGFQNVGMQRRTQPLTQIPQNFEADELTQEALADLDEKMMFEQFQEDL